MKIVINNLYKPYERGGAEKATELMIKNLIKDNHEVVLITTKPRGEITPIETELKSYYLSSSFYNLNKLSFLTRYVWHFFNILNYCQKRRIKKILQEEKPNLVITHNLMGLGFQIPKAIKELNIEHHHFLHDIQLLHPSGLMYYGKEKALKSIFAKTYQRINRKLFSQVDKVISPSQWLLTEHTSRNFFQKSKQEIRPFQWPMKDVDIEVKNNTEKTFLFVGQIEKHKGILLLVDTFKKISNNNIRLKIVGNGNQLKHIKRISKKDNRIECLGRKDGLELVKIMKRSNCLIVPSLCYENSPTVIYQAQNLNIPVIASNIGGIPEITKDSKLLFTPNNEEDLKKKIEMI